MNLKSKFNFSIAELSDRIEKSLIDFDRDAPEFEEYGLDSYFKEVVVTKNEQLKNIPYDAFYESIEKVKTKFKNEMRESLIKEIHNICNKIKPALDLKSIDSSYLSFEESESQNDSYTLSMANNIIDKTKSIINQPIAQNITKSDLNRITKSTDLFKSAINDLSLSITKRKQKSAERIQLANELYGLLGEICEVGKIIWNNKNEIYYMDFVIYASTKSIA